MNDYTLDLLETKIKRIKELESKLSKCRRKKEQVENACGIYKYRINKAIEFIKDNVAYLEDMNRCVSDLRYDDCDELLKILKGEENEK